MTKHMIMLLIYPYLIFAVFVNNHKHSVADKIIAPQVLQAHCSKWFVAIKLNAMH